MGDWGDSGSTYDSGVQASTSNDSETKGHSFGGKGRGFAPHKVEESFGGGQSSFGGGNQSSFGGGNRSDFGDRRGRGGGRGGRGGGYRNDGDRNGGGGGGWRNNDDGQSGGSSWSNNRRDDNRDDNRQGGWGDGGSGGSFSNDRKRDEWGGSNNRRNNDDDRNGGGGWNSGGRRDNDDGGESRRRDDRSGGGGWNSGGRRDNDDGGESRRRDDRSGGGGWNSGGRRDDDDGGENRRGRRDGDREDRGNGGGWNDKDDNRQDGVGEGEGEKKPITYVPKDLTTDELFSETGIERGINFDDYENIEVKITGENAPKPIKTFAEAQFRDIILNNLRKCRYDKPTPIQKHAIPAIMDGRDLMATAQTGSGKTAAYLLPIINSLLSGGCEAAGGKCCSPQALILSPTRELAIQIRDNAKLYTAQSTLKVEILYGGVSTRHQGTRISMGCNIMIATPGRLCDFLNRGWLKFDAIQFVVLDEADRMLDMGFAPAVEQVMNHESMTPASERQTLMFSATFSAEIQRMASKYLRSNYLFVTVGMVGGACKDVEQNFVEVEWREKKKELLSLLERGDPTGTLVFVETQKQADFLACFLSDRKIKTTSIHGARLQNQREEALMDFKSKRMSVLVATNVAARGLDIVGVKHVINFDLPKEIDEYVHRIGRTGRLGNRGKATSFYDPTSNNDLANNLVRILKQANQSVPDFLQAHATGGGDYEHSAFGGTDYRKSGDNGYGNNQGSNQAGDEESWD